MRKYFFISRFAKNEQMRLLTAIGFILLSVACHQQDKKSGNTPGLGMGVITDSSKFTTLEWLDSTNRSFGKIAEGQKLEVAFRFRNTGTQPLVINRVQPSCGCTIAEQPDQPVLPGQEGVIKASFNSEGRVGINHKTLSVYANTKSSYDLHFDVEVDKKKW